MESDNERETETALRRWADEVLIEWNVEEAGAAIPADGDGLMRIGLGFAIEIVQAWSEEVKTAAPLAPANPGSLTPSVNGGEVSPVKSSEKARA